MEGMAGISRQKTGIVHPSRRATLGADFESGFQGLHRPGANLVGFPGVNCGLCLCRLLTHDIRRGEHKARGGDWYPHGCRPPASLLEAKA